MKIYKEVPAENKTTLVAWYEYISYTVFKSFIDSAARQERDLYFPDAVLLDATDHQRYQVDIFRPDGCTVARFYGIVEEEEEGKVGTR